MRIKGQHWKQYRCCGQRKVLKAIPYPHPSGMGTQPRVAFVCQRCGKGEVLPPDVVAALKREVHAS